MTRRVLITGASGFIGSNVLAYLLDHTDWTFVAVASWRHKGDPMRLWPLFKNQADRLEVRTHDLTGPVPELGDFDYMLHLASQSHVDRSIHDPVHFIENNVSSTLQILEYARSHPPRVFLQFSTDEVYGERFAPGGVDEWAVAFPSNPYSASKAAQEMIAIAYWRTYGVPVVITNSSNVIGPGQDSEKFLPRLIDAVETEAEVAIHTSDGRPGSRFYNPVQNVADAIMFVLDRKPATHGRPDRYHLSGGEEMTNLELACEVAQRLGKPLCYRLVDVHGLRPGYDRRYAELGGRLRELGWSPPVTLGDALKEMLA